MTNDSKSSTVINNYYAVYLLVTIKRLKHLTWLLLIARDPKNSPYVKAMQFINPHVLWECASPIIKKQL